jgi:prophage antirepressor-like protein
VVLPAIRRDGVYIMGEEKLSAAALREAEEGALLTKVLEMLNHKVERLRAERDQRMAHNAELTDSPHALSRKAR